MSPTRTLHNLGRLSNSLPYCNNSDVQNHLCPNHMIFSPLHAGLCSFEANILHWCRRTFPRGKKTCLFNACSAAYESPMPRHMRSGVFVFVSQPPIGETCSWSMVIAVPRAVGHSTHSIRLRSRVRGGAFLTRDRRNRT